ncbi:hypothetical protein FB107DRAFT_279675 [Schizophyllum commune]
MVAAPVDIKAYVLTHDEEERRCLDGQHLIVQRAFGRDRIAVGHTHPLTLHPLIDPLSIRAVLHVGAGTSAAIVDVARLVHGVRETTGNNRTVSMPGADGTNGDTLNSSGDALSSNGDLRQASKKYCRPQSQQSNRVHGRPRGEERW